ncbi:MAG: hypothetical protein IJD45_06685 [Clostridia bacterium]|nr:hypothetical protein [Clostridia bacterium]
MKKILNIILCALVAVSLFTVAVSASAVEVTPLGGTGKTADFSEDYTHLTFEEQTYTIVDDSNLYYGGYYFDEEQKLESISLTAEQGETVSSLDLTAYMNGLVVDAEYTLNTGAELSITYINDNYFDPYNKALNGEIEEIYIHFDYPSDNYFETTISKLKENKKTIDFAYIDTENFNVCIDIGAESKSVGVISGNIVLKDGVYYYLDYKDAGIKNVEEWQDYIDTEKTYTVYEITDPDTVWGLENCYNLYNEDLGFVNDEEIAEALVDALATIVFGVLPLAVLVLSIIFGIRFKEKYRKLFITLGTIAVAELIVFAIISILLK